MRKNFALLAVVLAVLLLATGCKNKPPLTPARPSGPDTVAVNATATYTSSATDPNKDEIRYVFDWGYNDKSDTSEYLPSGDTVSLAHAWSDTGTYEVRARAQDGKGNWSADWSDIKPVYVSYAGPGDNDPPGKPILSGPARGIMNGPMYLFSGFAIDPNGDDLVYKFFWGDGRESDWTPAHAHSAWVPDSVRYDAAGTYNVRCIARDVHGAISDTSDAVAFATVAEGEIIWSFGTGECVSSPAWAVVQGADEMLRPAVVIANLDGWMYAIDAWQGNRLREENIPESEGFNSSPSVSADGGTIYIGGNSGQLFARNNQLGPKWYWPDSATDIDVCATPAVDGADIYGASESGLVFKVSDEGAGATRRWTYQTIDNIYASPVLSGDRVIVCDDSGYVYFLNPANGEKIADFLCDGGLIASPAVAANGNIYVGTDQGIVYAISPVGTQVWKYTMPDSIPSEIFGSPVVASDGGVIFGADNGRLYKLDPASGEPMTGWPIDLTAAGIASTPAVCADGVIYVVSDDNVLHALGNNGARLWTVNFVPGRMAGRGRGPGRLSIDALSPSVMVDQYGIIYASAGDNLFAVAGRGSAGRLATTSWPMFQHDVRHSGKAGSW